MSSSSTLKNTLIALTLAAVALLSNSAFAASEFYESIWEENDYRSLRVDGMLDPEGNADGDEEINFQIGFGLGLTPVDEIGILFGHADADAGNRTYVSFWMEENYTAIGSVIPFAGVNIGWAKFDGDGIGGESEDSVYGKVEFGGKYFVCPHCAIVGTAGFSLALENIYLTDAGADDKNFELSLGARWYY